MESEITERVAHDAPLIQRLWTRRGDFVVTLVLTTASLLTAWAGYQASKWGGLQSINFSEAGAARTEANTASTLGGQFAAIDSSALFAWLKAFSAELEDLDLTGTPEDEVPERLVEIATDSSTLPGFLFDRFRPEFRAATLEWLDTNPFLDPDAPSSPFDLGGEQFAQFELAEELRSQAEASAAKARENNQQSDNYVLLTVLFATVLFLAGLSQKLNSEKAQAALFTVAVVLLVFSVFGLLRQPVEIGEFGIL